jgi:hypothetical protein
VTNSTRSTVHAARDALRQAADLLRIRHWSAAGAYEAAGDLPPVLPDEAAAVPGADSPTR